MFVRIRKIVRTMLRREQAPALRCYLLFGHTLDNIFPVNSPIRISVATYFPTTILSNPRWQSIFIPAQGSPYTIKTVGGEAVRRFFSLKYAVLLYTLSTLFTDPPLRQQKIFQESFLLSFFSKKRNRIPRVPSHPRVLLFYTNEAGDTV